jgi:DNA-directed RNA polymerase specialized sigma subunit
MLRKWHFYKAIVSASETGGELKKQIDAIERVIYALDDENAKIIKLHYFDGVGTDTIAGRIHISERAVFYRLTTIIKDIQYILGMIE